MSVLDYILIIIIGICFGLAIFSIKKKKRKGGCIGCSSKECTGCAKKSK